MERKAAGETFEQPVASAVGAPRSSTTPPDRLLNNSREGSSFFEVIRSHSTSSIESISHA
jgi:hypothetical protein